MNRNFGASAGVIALMMFVLHMAIPGSPEAGSGVPTGSGTARGQPAVKTAPTKTKDAERAVGKQAGTDATLEGPWLATRPFFATPGTPAQPDQKIDFNSVESVRNCSRDATHKGCEAVSGYFGLNDPTEVRFLLATVPDPMHTRLSLFTDSSIQAIQRAATDAGWTFARQWLPWHDAIDPDEKDPRERTKEREFIENREQQPGVLVFRNKEINLPEVLLIFLVGETPTAGVNVAQFQFARAYIRGIQEPDHVTIQGPTFSGSLYSLNRLVGEDWLVKMRDPFPYWTGMGVKPYLVSSGTVTDIPNAEKLNPLIDFHSASAEAPFTTMLTRLRIKQGEAATLIEDESDYGQSVSDRDFAIRAFRFPRDISHLRNAFREAEATSSGAPAPDLDFSLKDSEIGEDSIPTFSGTQSPLSQNAVLDEITGAIRRDRIRMVKISATNVLDTLFLARILRRECPDTRLLISFPDLLFVEAAQTGTLTGTLALSNYPIFNASNDWIQKHGRPATFSDVGAEGIYNATRLLLDHGGNDGLYDYRWDARASGGTEALFTPATWLLTLDRQGFTPVRLFRGVRNLFEEAPAAALPDLRLPDPSVSWSFLSTLTALVSVALAGWTLLLFLKKTLVTNTAFAVDSIDTEQDGRRLFYVFLLGLVLAAIQIVIGAPFWLYRPGWSSFSTVILPGIGIVAVAVGAVPAMWRANGGHLKSWLRTIFTLMAFLAVTVMWILCCKADGEEGFFFSFRAVELRVGSSPAVPVLAALCVFLMFSMVHLARLYLAVYEKPDVMLENFETILQPQIRLSCNRFNESAESVLGFSTKPSWKEPQWLALCAAFVAAIVLFVQGHLSVHLSSIDGSLYNILSTGLMLAAAASLLFACCHTMVLWNALQALLTCLDTLPIAIAFVRPDHSGVDRPLWVRRLSLQSIDIHANALIVLHDMARKRKVWKKHQGTYREKLENLVAEEPPQTRLQAFFNRQAIRTASTDIAREAFQLARKEWISHGLVKHLDPQSAPAEEAESHRRQAILEIDGDPGEIGDLAGTFVALHYSPYLIYGVRQIRNLMLFLPAGFVFLVVSMDSYSHQSPRIIGRLLLALFVAIGAVIWTCLAGMERDPILSRISGTPPGKLTLESYLKVIGYVAVPVVGLLASQFPAISNFLYSWIAPTLQSAH